MVVVVHKYICGVKGGRANITYNVANYFRCGRFRNYTGFVGCEKVYCYY